MLVKTTPVTGGVPRVSAVSVTPGRRGRRPGSIPSTTSRRCCNDRPPLVLEATINRTSTTSFPIVVVVTDLAGLERDRRQRRRTDRRPSAIVSARKRRQQAEFLANYVQARLTANPAEHLVVIGGFNAFEMNDGFVDVMDVVAGTPAARQPDRRAGRRRGSGESLIW